MRKLMLMLLSVSLLLFSCSPESAQLEIDISTPADRYIIRLSGKDDFEKKIITEDGKLTVYQIKPGIYEIEIYYIQADRIIESESNDIRITQGINVYRAEGHDSGRKIIIEDVSSAPASGKIEILDVDKKNEVITLRAEAEKGDEYYWFVDGKYYTSGKIIQIDMRNSAKRIDVVFSSKEIGSLGSQSIIFYVTEKGSQNT